jgi:quercetin dioxygenase-like cupin family protein
MTKALRLDADRGAALVLGPGEGESHWQPVPANGYIDVLIAPHLVEMQNRFSMGTQTVPPGGYVREHAHPEHDEVLHFISGNGKALIDGVEHPAVPGTTVFVGRNRRHKFVNDGDIDLHWLWFIAPHGLEEFFRLVGRSRRRGDPVPANFPRPDDVLEIERRTAFAPPAGEAS